MKAMAITGSGGTEVFQMMERPKPTIGEFDLLVEVHATSINPVDCKVRKNSKMTRAFPAILGYDVCGSVVAMGDRVTGFQIGDEIYASPNVARDGANAEYVAVDSRSAARKPKTLDSAAAAVLPLVSLTAWESLHLRAKIQPGQTILIHAGAGGVGHIAIQLAKLHGCTVITTAGRDQPIQFCKEVLKADEVIDYRTADFVDSVMDLTAGKGCSTIIDTVGGDVFVRSLDAISVNGQLVTIVPTETTAIAEKLFLKNATLHYEFMGVPTVHNLNPERQGDILSVIGNLVDNHLIHPHVSQKINLLEIPEGHKLQETGHIRGKIAVMVG